MKKESWEDYVAVVQRTKMFALATRRRPFERQEG